MVARIRGETYGAMSLGELLQTESSVSKADDLQQGVLISDKNWTMLLMVHAVLGQRKVVVSDLADILPHCDQITGVAQQGGGKLALVLSAPELLRPSAQEAVAE